MRIKTFWFDLGNVLLDFDFKPAFKRLSRHTSLTAGQIERFVVSHPTLEADCDTGRVPASGLYRLFKQSLGLKSLTYAEFKDIWNDIFTPNHKMIRLISKLKRNGYRLILISNTNRLHFDYLEENYPMLRLFDRHVLSYRLRCRKPDSLIYRYALKYSRAKPGEIFYTDDRHNLTSHARRAIGVHAHTFTSHEDLMKNLSQFNILRNGRDA